MRVLGIDYGTKRVGLALSSEDGSFALPHSVVQNTPRLVSEIEALCRGKGVGKVVIGASLDYKKRPNVIMRDITRLKERIETQLNLPVVLEDETLTTQAAIRIQGRHARTDASAAALILQSYLDRIITSQQEKKPVAKTKHRFSFRDWVWRRAESRGARTALFIHAFAEASFFPVPPDILLISLLVTNARKWVAYALITTIGSVAGGVVGYGIGFFFYESVGRVLVESLSLERAFESIAAIYDQYAFLGVFAAGFTPIPYKVFTIAGGLFEINFFTFLFASVLSRGLRFLLVAYASRVLGARLSDVIYRYFNIISILVVLTLVFFFVFI